MIDGSLVEVPRQRNTPKYSTIRCRVEHVFGFCKQSMHGMFICVIGIVRNTAHIHLMNLVYNMCRYEQIIRLGMN